MYKIASDNAQRAVSRQTLSELAHGEQDLSPEDERGNLVAQLKALQAKNAAETRPWRKKALGKEIFELTERIRKIRPKAKCKGVDQFFIDAARDVLAKGQFDAVMKVAVNRWRAAQPSAESTRSTED